MAWTDLAGRGAPLPELAREAWDNVLALRQRSALAVLGILVGTASVVAMLSIGHMAGREALKPFAAMGVDQLSVQAVGGDGDVRLLDLARLEALPRSVPEVLAVSGFALGQTAPDLTMAPPPTLVAAFPSLRTSAGLSLAQGRFLFDTDAQNLVAVVGSAVARPASPGRRAVGLGDRVRAGSYLFQVVGILAPAPHNALSPADFDHSIIIPFGGGRRAMGAVAPTGALVRIAPAADEKAVAAQVERALAAPGAPSGVRVQNARQAVTAIRAQKAVHARLLAALGGISLLVGGLGVMNVMLMGMIERRREIGLRTALGATPRDIQLMFLTEAAVLAVVGGVAGTLLGVLVAFGVAQASSWRFGLAAYALPLGPGVAMAVGLAFGLYPAIKAARLDPIDALRTD